MKATAAAAMAGAGPGIQQHAQKAARNAGIREKFGGCRCVRANSSGSGPCGRYVAPDNWLLVPVGLTAE